MGIFSKISGVDARFKKYKQRALNILEIVRSQAEEDDRDFENIMCKINVSEDQSLKLSIFLAGAVAEFEENKELQEVRGWKIITLSDALDEVMSENGYHEWGIHGLLMKNPVINTKKRFLWFFKQISCSHGGRLVAIRIKNNDDINARLNITIFLDTLEALDGYYADFKSNQFTVDSYELGNF